MLVRTSDNVRRGLLLTSVYHGQDDVRMWVFSKNTIAGDLGVTPIIQCLASMLITSTLVHTDLHHHAISPLPFVYPHVESLPDPRILLGRLFPMKKGDPEANLEKLGQASDSSVHDQQQVSQAGFEETQSQGEVKDEKLPRGIKFYYLMLIRFIFEGTENNMMLARIPLSHWFGRLVWTAAQGAGIGIVFGFPIWCLAIVILGPIYGTGNMGNKWAPQIIKLVYGAIVGWITNPVIAILALGSQAESHLLVVEHAEAEEAAGEEGGTADTGTVDRVQTIQEDEELVVPPSGLLRPTLPESPSQTPSQRIALLNLTATPTLTRSRASSGARPPLTANVSQLPSYSQGTATTPRIPPSPGLGTPQPGFLRERGSSVSSSLRPATRPRGLTASSAHSAGYSYALGGTGGRAKRSNTATSKEIREGVPALGLPVVAPSTPSASAAPIAPNSPAFPSTIPSAASHSMSVPNRSPLPPTERVAAWDVFGKKEDVPMSPPPSKRRSTGGSVPSTPQTS